MSKRSIFYKKHYKKLLTMLSLCKKEIQLQNLLKNIVDSEHKIYLLIQIVKFSNSGKNVRWPQAATATCNV